jgi:hypothetical protein
MATTPNHTPLPTSAGAAIELGPLVKDPKISASYLIDKSAEAAYFGHVNEWTERAAVLHGSLAQSPTPTDDGLGLRYPTMTLYHGSAASGITEFLPAEDTTFGDGLYATSMPDQAFGYAVKRADPRSKVGNTILAAASDPVVYELEVTDSAFLDLRNPENSATTFAGYGTYLEQWLTTDQGNTDMIYADIVAKIVHIIRQSSGGSPLNPKDILHQTSGLFTDYVTSMAYDGVIALEGGEGGYTANHDSWVIMKPTTARVTNQLSFVTPCVLNEVTPHSPKRSWPW